MSDRSAPEVRDADSFEVGRGRPVRVRIYASANLSSTHDMTRGEAYALRAQLDQWLTENRKSRRRGGLRADAERRNSTMPVEQRQEWPPDPVWGTDDRGRFHYTDYDGESLHVWRDREGELWIDKKGEGPVYVRPQDVTVVLGAIQAPQPRVPESCPEHLMDGRNEIRCWRNKGHEGDHR